MRGAIITDLHGNLAALHATLDAIDAAGVDRVLCGGDLVGYGPNPNEVCARIAEREIPTIHGNHDHAIARGLEDCAYAYRNPAETALGERSIAWTLAHTGQAAKDFMRALPFDLRFEMGDRRVRLVHGSPRKVNEYLFEDKPGSLYERLARAAGATSSSSATRTSPGSGTTAACGSSTVDRSASPRTATHGPRSRYWSSWTVESRPVSSGSRTTRHVSPARSPRRAFPPSSATSS